MESLTSEFGMGSGVPSPLWLPKKFGKFIETGMEGFFEKQDARAISTGQLHPSQGFHLQPINEVVYLGPSGDLKRQGELILRQASRLDAFSGYPFHT